MHGHHGTGARETQPTCRQVRRLGTCGHPALGDNEARCCRQVLLHLLSHLVRGQEKSSRKASPENFMITSRCSAGRPRWLRPTSPRDGSCLNLVSKGTRQLDLISASFDISSWHTLTILGTSPARLSDRPPSGRMHDDARDVLCTILGLIHHRASRCGRLPSLLLRWPPSLGLRLNGIHLGLLLLL